MFYSIDFNYTHDFGEDSIAVPLNHFFILVVNCERVPSNARAYIIFDERDRNPDYFSFYVPQRDFMEYKDELPEVYRSGAVRIDVNADVFVDGYPTDYIEETKWVSGTYYRFDLSSIRQHSLSLL